MTISSAEIFPFLDMEHIWEIYGTVRTTIVCVAAEAASLRDIAVIFIWRNHFAHFFFFFLLPLFLSSFFGGLVKEGKRWGFVVKLPFIFYPFGMFYYFLMQMGTFYFIGVGNHHRPSFLFQKYSNVTEFWQLLENLIWKKVFENFPSTVM